MAGRNRIFINCAGSRTQSAVMTALKAQGAPITAYARSMDPRHVRDPGADRIVEGSMLDLEALTEAMEDASLVVHVAPALQDMEVMMGHCAIEAARRANVGRFIYVSVIHPQIDYLMNHKAKLAVEDHLIGSGLAWTIVRPMHYFQNLDIRAAVDTGRLQLTYSVEQQLGFLDMADLAEVVARVATEDGHEHAAYDLCSADSLSGIELANMLSRLVGRCIEPARVPLDRLAGLLAPQLASGPHSLNWTASAIERLFLYYDRFGLRGNANVARWLLGREPAGFLDFARRELGRAG